MNPATIAMLEAVAAQARAVAELSSKAVANARVASVRASLHAKLAKAVALHARAHDELVDVADDLASLAASENLRALRAR